MAALSRRDATRIRWICSISRADLTPPISWRNASRSGRIRCTPKMQAAPTGPGSLTEIIIPDPTVIYQPSLCIQELLIPASRPPFIGSVAFQDACFDVIHQLDRKNIGYDRFSHRGIFNGKQHFDPAVKVTRHEICTSQKDLFIAPVMEIINPCMFKEPPDNRTHRDIFAYLMNFRSRATDTPHVQLNVHPACDARYSAAM